MSKAILSLHTLNHLHGLRSKPRRRMSRAERAAYDAWNNWLSRSLVVANERGIGPVMAMITCMAEAKGISGPVSFEDAEAALGLPTSAYILALDMGVRLAEFAGISIRANAPPLPLVFPGESYSALPVGWLCIDTVLRHGIGK